MSPVDAMAHNWSFAIYIFGIVFICTFMLAIPVWLGGRAKGRATNEPFESGIVPAGGARIRFSAKFYLIAMFLMVEGNNVNKYIANKSLLIDNFVSIKKS